MSSKQAPPTELATERLLAGRYRYVRELGKGALGRVLLVEDAHCSNALRAVKAVAPSEATWLHAEFAALSSISHPNVAKVFELLRLEEGRERVFDLPPHCAWLVEEYVQGETADLAAQKVRQHGSELELWVVNVGLSVAAALSTVHAMGLVHGDIKPSNILATSNAASVGHTIRLIDFSLARPIGLTAGLHGTPDFWAPESLLGECSPATDLYALGVTLKMLLSSSGTSDALGKISPQLEELLESLTKPNKRDRASSARAVARSLQSIAILLGDASHAASLTEDESAAEQAARALTLARIASDASVAQARDLAQKHRIVWVSGPPRAGCSLVVREVACALQADARETRGPVPTYHIAHAVPTALPTHATVLHLTALRSLGELEAWVEAATLADVSVHAFVDIHQDPPPNHVGVRVEPLAAADIHRLFQEIFPRAGEASQEWIKHAQKATGGFAGRLCLSLHDAIRMGANATDARVWNVDLASADADARPLNSFERRLLSNVALAGGILRLPVAFEGVPPEGQELALLSCHRQALLSIAETGELRMARHLRDQWLTSLHAEEKARFSLALLPLVDNVAANAHLRFWSGDDDGATGQFLGAIESALKQGLFADALELAGDAWECLPLRVAIRNARANLLRAAGRYADAADIVREATDTEGLWLRCELARLVGDAGQASRWLGTHFTKQDLTGDLSALRARLLFDSGDFANATKAAQKTLVAATAIRARVRATEVLSLAASREGDFILATRIAHDALRLAQGSSDSSLEARATSLVSSALMQQGQRVAAASFAKRAVQLADRVGEVHACAVYRVNLGLAQLEDGDLGAAFDALLVGAQELTRIGRRAEVARALYNAACAASLSGNDAVSFALAKRSRELAAELGDSILEGFTTLVEADNYAHASRPELAVERMLSLNGAAEPLHLRLAWASRLLVLRALNAEVRVASNVAELIRRKSDSTLSASLLVEQRLSDAALLWSETEHAASLAAFIALRELTTDSTYEQRLRVALTGASIAERAGDRTSASLFLADARSLLDRAATSLSEHGRAMLRSCIAYQRAFASRPARNLPSTTASNENGERWRALAGLAKNLVQERTSARIEEEALRAALALTGAERAFLLVADERMEISILAYRDVRGGTAQPSELSRSLVSRVVLTQAPDTSLDAMTDSQFAQSASAHSLLLRSVAAVPIRYTPEQHGALYVDDRLRPAAFGREELELLRDLAELVSLAFDSAAQRARQEETALSLAAAHEQLERTVLAQGLALSALRTADLSRAQNVHEEGLVAASPGMRQALALAVQVAASDVPVLIMGESGTGKELIARAIHRHSTRASRPMVSENCGAIPEPLLESALFGHVRGAFTGADRIRAGLFEVADGGTLLLDEIAELSPAMQVKFLRVLQSGEVRAVGSDRVRNVDVRVIAATHRNVDEMVKSGAFREDLFYRLAVVTIVVPPLRERVDDIAPLVAHFIERYAKGRPIRIEPHALAALQAFSWPGNVRQLENEIQRALVLCKDLLRVDHLSDPVRGKGTSSLSTSLNLRVQTDSLEKRLIKDALAETGQNQTRAAKLLGVSRFGLQKMMKRLGFNS